MSLLLLSLRLPSRWNRRRSVLGSIGIRLESVNVVFLVSDQFRQLEKCECVLFYAPSFRLCRNCFVLVPFSGSLAGRIKKERGGELPVWDSTKIWTPCSTIQKNRHISKLLKKVFSTKMIEHCSRKKKEKSEKGVGKGKKAFPLQSC